MGLNKLDQIFALWQQKTHYTSVAGQVGLCPSYVSNVMSAFDKHSYETVKEVFVDKIYKPHQYTVK